MRVDKVNTASVRCKTSCKEPLSMYSNMMAVFGETVHAPSHRTIDGCRKVDKTETSLEFVQSFPNRRFEQFFYSDETAVVST